MDAMFALPTPEPRTIFFKFDLKCERHSSRCKNSNLVSFRALNRMDSSGRLTFIVKNIKKIDMGTSRSVFDAYETKTHKCSKVVVVADEIAEKGKVNVVRAVDCIHAYL